MEVIIQVSCRSLLLFAHRGVRVVPIILTVLFLAKTGVPG